MTFSLRGLVEHVVRTSTVASPTDLAGLVRKQIEPGDVGAALDEALVAYVHRHVVLDRMRPAPASDAPTVGPSKLAGVAAVWQRQLSNRIHVGDGYPPRPGSGGWHTALPTPHTPLGRAATSDGGRRSSPAETSTSRR